MWLTKQFVIISLPLCSGKRFTSTPQPCLCKTTGVYLSALSNLKKLPPSKGLDGCCWTNIGSTLTVRWSIGDGDSNLDTISTVRGFSKLCDLTLCIFCWPVFFSRGLSWTGEGELRTDVGWRMWSPSFSLQQAKHLSLSCPQYFKLPQF